MMMSEEKKLNPTFGVYYSVRVDRPDGAGGYQRLSFETSNQLFTEALDAYIETKLTPRELAEQRAELLAILTALSTNPCINLGDLAYEIREREGKGWDGPAVAAWSDAVQRAKAAIAKAKGE